MKKKTLLALALCSAVVASPAFAEDPPEGEVTVTSENEAACATNADCGEGFLCQEVSTGDCVAAPCAEGEACPEVECEPSATSAICVPAPPPSCESNADCSGGLKCVTYTQSSCSGASPGAEPGTSEGSSGSSEGSEGSSEGTETTPEECQEETVGYCLPPYLAPCEASSDCGAGFECKPAEVCGCSGGSAGSSDGTGEPGTELPPEGECSCEATGEGYCELIPVACDAETACADGFVCQESYEGGVSSGTCSVNADGEQSCTDVEPTEPVEAESFCVPADWERYGSGGGGMAADTGMGQPRGEENMGAPTSGGGTLDADEASVKSDGDADEEEGGCSTTGSGSSAPIGLLGLAVAWAVGRVRRRR